MPVAVFLMYRGRGVWLMNCRQWASRIRPQRSTIVTGPLTVAAVNVTTGRFGSSVGINVIVISLSLSYRLRCKIRFNKDKKQIKTQKNNYVICCC